MAKILKFSESPNLREAQREWARKVITRRAERAAKRISFHPCENCRVTQVVHEQTFCSLCRETGIVQRIYWKTFSSA